MPELIFSLFSRKVDSLAAGGLIIADIWAGQRIITVDQLGDEFLETIKDGDEIEINQNCIIKIY